tara:strand:+ start:46 stop:384 length:339 start_codon:yes stop_codon:yes gene_type:complete
MSKKGQINKRLGVTKNNYKKLIPQLEKVISTLPKDGKNNKELLREGLKKIGWSDNEIRNFSKLKSRDHLQKKYNPNQKTSPSFKNYKNKVGQSKTNPKPYQGGSPGLGKGKS